MLNFVYFHNQSSIHKITIEDSVAGFDTWWKLKHGHQLTSGNHQ